MCDSLIFSSCHPLVLFIFWPWKYMILAVIFKVKDWKNTFSLKTPTTKWSISNYGTLTSRIKNIKVMAIYLQTKCSFSKSNFVVVSVWSVTNLVVWYFILFILTWTKYFFFILTLNTCIHDLDNNFKDTVGGFLCNFLSKWPHMSDLNVLFVILF
jgi:hypothetical protein